MLAILVQYIFDVKRKVAKILATGEMLLEGEYAWKPERTLSAEFT